MSANVSEVNLTDGRIVCLSYGAPVAVFFPRGCSVFNGNYTGPWGYLRSATYRSVTSSRHANAFAGADAPKVDAATFALMVAPLEVRP